MRTERFFRGLILGIIVTGLFFTPNLRAQYSTGFGLRIGGTSGLDIKHFYKPAKAFEGIIGTFGNGISFTGLIEKYSPIYNAPGLYVYYGGGAHLAFYNGKG